MRISNFCGIYQIQIEKTSLEVWWGRFKPGNFEHNGLRLTISFTGYWSDSTDQCAYLYNIYNRCVRFRNPETALAPFLGTPESEIYCDFRLPRHRNSGGFLRERNGNYGTPNLQSSVSSSRNHAFIIGETSYVGMQRWRLITGSPYLSVTGPPVTGVKRSPLHQSPVETSHRSTGHRSIGLNR